MVVLGAPVIARTDGPDALGWRVYRVAPNGVVIYDRRIEDDPANAALALAALRGRGGAAASRRQAARPRERGGAHAVARRPADRAPERPGEAPVAGGPAGGGALSRGKAAAHDAPHGEPRRPAVDANRCPWSATGAALQRAGPPVDAVHRHAADDPAVATILTTAHAIHRITVAFSAGRISIAHATAAPLCRSCAPRHQPA